MADAVKKEGVKGETLQVKVRDQNGEETVFKIKTTTRMSKVFDAYATRKGVEASQLRFFLDGERINGDHTPADLEIEDNDQIDCMIQQQGGCC